MIKHVAQEISAYGNSEKASRLEQSEDNFVGEVEFE